jgi:hypothetical protein
MRGFLRADDGDRTRDPQLGKLMLYQLSYVRALAIVTGPLVALGAAGRRHRDAPRRT